MRQYDDAARVLGNDFSGFHEIFRHASRSALRR
jgi:hypothetical protein